MAGRDLLALPPIGRDLIGLADERERGLSVEEIHALRRREGRIAVDQRDVRAETRRQEIARDISRQDGRFGARGTEFTAETSPNLAESIVAAPLQPMLEPEQFARDQATVGRTFVQNLDDRLGRVVGGIIEAVPEIGRSLDLGAQVNRSTLEAQMQREGLTADQARQALDSPAEEWLRGAGRGIFERASRELERNDPEVGGIARFQYDLMNAFVDLGAAMGVTAATRSPTAGAAVIGAQVFGDRYGESIRQGRTPEQAFQDGIFYAIPEFVGERVVIGALMRPGGRLAGVATGAVSEGVQEMVTETLQTAYDAGIIGEEMTLGEVVGRIGYAGLIGGGAGAGIGAIRGPVRSRVGVVEDSGVAEITPEDEASPLPTDLIAEGKASVDTALAGVEADRILDETINRQTGDRVSVTIGGQSRTGTVRDAFVEPDEETGEQQGVVIDWDGGGQSRERIADLSDAGARFEKPGRDILAEPEIVVEGPRVAAPRRREPEDRPVPVADAGAVAREVYPNIRITQVARDPNSALGRANPRSWHTRTRAAVDSAPIPGMTFNEYVQGYRDAGYSIIEAIDEVRNPSRHATGPHWHIVLGTGGRDGGGVAPNVETAEIQPDYDWIEEGLPADEAVETPPAEREVDLTGSAAERTFPMAPRGDWYGEADYEQRGGRIVEMTPDEYLSRVRPLEIDEISRENIDDLKAHIESGRSLDPLLMRADGREDGRHRAVAARELGIARVPVVVFDQAGDGASTAPAQDQPAETPRVLDFEDYAAERGAGRSGFGDAGAHSPAGNVGRSTRRAQMRRLAEDSAALSARRAELQTEYDASVERGEVRPLTSTERLERTAAGDPNMSATQAAIRVLERRAGRAGAKDDTRTVPVQAETRRPQITVERGGVVITDATESDVARINEALPGRTRAIPRSDGAFVAPKKHEETIRTALAGDGTREAPVRAETAEDVDRAAEQANPEPTPAQAEAGVYAKGHIKLQGLDISIETPKGAMRRGVDADGTPWEAESPTHYGYIKRSTGADDEQLDVYVGPEPASLRAFVIDQVDADTREFDESKVMLGYRSKDAALADYRAAFSDGRGDERIGAVTGTTVEAVHDLIKKPQTGPIGTIGSYEPVETGGIASEGQLQSDNVALPEEATETVTPAFDPETQVGAMRDLIASSNVSLNDSAQIGRRLGLEPGQVDAVLGVIASRPNSGIRQTKGRSAGIRKTLVSPAVQKLDKGGRKLRTVKAARYKSVQYRAPTPPRFQRLGARTAPVDLMAFVRGLGGVRSDRHDLRNVGGLARFPGVINNKSGRSLDDLGEAMVSGGWAEERPTESEVLELLERGSTAKMFRPEDVGEQADGGAERAALRSLAADLPEPLTEDDFDAAMAYRGEGESREVALDLAMRDAAAEVLEEHGTGNEFYEELAEAIYEGEIAEERADAGEAGEPDRGPAEAVAGPEGVESDSGESRPPDAEPTGAREEVETRAGVAPRGEAGPAATNATRPQPEEQLDAFGIQPGDERRALERAGEGRVKSAATQKPPGSEGGLFDVRDTTRDIEEAIAESPIAQARASLQQAMAALDQAEGKAAPEPQSIPDTPALRSLLRDWEHERNAGREPYAAWIVRRVADKGVETWSVKKRDAERRRLALQEEPEFYELARVRPKDFEGVEIVEEPGNVIPFPAPKSQSLFQRGPSVDRREFIKGATAVAAGFTFGGRLYAQPPGLTSILERSMQEAVPLPEALEWVAANSENAKFRKFAARMIPLVNGIIIRGNPVGRRTHTDGTPAPEDIWAGLAHGMHQVDEIADGDVVWLARGEWVDGFNEGTLIHEALHAAIYRMFGRLSVRMAGNDPALLQREGFRREATPRPASAAQIAELRRFYQEAVTAFERQVQSMSAEENQSDRTRHIRNGLGNPDEFLSYALENRDMQDFLRAPSSRAGTKTPSLWDKIVAFIRRALGLGDTPRSALDDALDTAYRLLADPQGPTREANAIVENSTAAEFNRGSTTGRSLFQARTPPSEWNARLNRARAINSTKWDRFTDSFDRIRTNFQDRMLPLLRTQTAIERSIGRELSEEERPYNQEALYTGRVGAQFEQMEDEFVAPMFEAMAEEKVTLDELESYLYARHAPERNAKLKAEGVDDGSGMSDIEAAAIMGRIDKAGKTGALERVAAWFDKLNAFALDTRVAGGLMSQEEADTWRARWKSYAPLRGHLEVPEDERPAVGKGYTVKGPESKRAFGRKSKAEDILAHAFMQAEEAIVRAEKNRVATELYNLAKENPDDNFWKVQKVSMRKRINKETGLVETYAVTNLTAEDAPFTVSLKVKGKAQRVTFNRQNRAAVRAAAAMRRMNEPELNFRVLQLVNQWLSKANTMLNPDFIWRNAFRDLETATANLSQFEMKGLRRDVIKSYPKALAAAERGAFKRGGDSEWDQAWNEFTAEGARVYYNNVQDVEELQRDINKRFARLNRKASVKQAGLDLWGALKWTFDKIEKANLGVENAVRLSAYKNLRDRGLSAKQAAFIAKELTTNFNRRGVYGVLMNSLYLFMNATTQGSTRMLLALKHRRTQKIAAGMVVAGALNAVYNILASGGDDDEEESPYDRISEYEKSTNLIFMIPGTDRYVKIPVAYGYNIFFDLGRNLVDVGRGHTRPLDAGGNWLMTVLNSFNPIGGQESLGNFLAPTVVDPAVDIMIDNRNFADQPIMPDLSPFDRSVPPDSQRYWPSVSPIFRGLTDALNRGTGGDEVRPGAIDISPETVEYMTAYITGAAGATIMRFGGGIGKSVDGDPTTALEINDVPVARTMVGTPPSWYPRAAFYERLGHVEEVVSQAREYRRNQDREGFRSFVEDERDVLRLRGLARSARREIRDIRRDKAQLELAVEAGRISDEREDQARTRLRAREDRLFERFSSVYLETVEEPRRVSR